MIQRMSQACAKNIISLGKLQNVNVAILQYGCELIITSIMGFLILISLSILIQHPLAWLFFVLGFSFHRTFAGGYHADTHTICFLVTSTMFLIGTIASIELTWHYLTYLAISLFSAAIVLWLAPLEAQNKPLSPKRFRNNRGRSLLIVSINIIISLIFAMINFVCREANLYFAGTFFAALSLIMGKIKNDSNGGKVNEN